MAVMHVTTRNGQQQDLTVGSKGGYTLMELLRDNNLEVEAICGGSCSCATCHVFIDDAWIGKLPPRGPDETELVEQTSDYRPNNSRLSCQIAFSDALDGLKVTIAPAE